MQEIINPINPKTAKKYQSLVEMTRELTQDNEFADEVKRVTQDRVLLDRLMSKRAAANFSQQDIARKMGCSQGRISKLENGTDRDLTIGDLEKYAKTLGLEVAFGIRPENVTISEQVKLHVFAIRKLLHRIADLAQDDETIVSGLKVFLTEVLFNTAISVEAVNQRFNKLVKNTSAEKPPLLVFDSDPEPNESTLTESA